MSVRSIVNYSALEDWLIKGDYTEEFVSDLIRLHRQREFIRQFLRYVAENGGQTNPQILASKAAKAAQLLARLDGLRKDGGT